MGENLRILKTSLQAYRAQLPYLPRILALIWSATRGWSVLWGVLLLAQGLLPVVTVHLIRMLVDQLVEAVGAGGSWQTVRPTLVLVALMAAILLVTELLSGVTRWVRTAQSELLEDHIVGRIHDKSTAVDLAFYELPEYYDHLHRAHSEASYRPFAMLESMGNLLQSGITLLGMVAVLIPFGLWLPAALLVSTLPAFYVVLRYGLLEHQWRLRRTADERRAWYYDWLLTARESASEVRLFGLERHFRSLYQELRGRLRSERLELVQAQTLAELKAGAAALSISAVALGWLVWRALQGVVTLGVLALFYQAFNQGQRLMRLLLENLGQIAANSRFLGDLFEFLDLKPQVKSPGSPSPVPRVLQKGISFHQVQFGYPGSECAVLDDFSLTIPPGQTTAVVGPNGAGKTTLIKLICRLYDPQWSC